MGDKKPIARRDIELAPFKVGDSEVWMPVAAEQAGYSSERRDEPPITSEPTVLEKVYVVKGTMEFNKHPGREVFTIKYKPGTPISDSLRKMTYEFGQQKISPRPTRAETEEMLKDQLAQAEEQKSRPVVATMSEGFPWSTWLAGGFGALVVISSILLWFQRRGR